MSSDLGSADDRELIRRHRDGDPGAFSELVRRHHVRLWSVALRTMRDPDDAADAVQDAWIKALRNADQYRGESAVTTWLHRIVVNACLDRLRRRAARPTSTLNDDGDPAVSPTVGFVDVTDIVDRALDVAAALQTLPEEQRVALELVDLGGLSVAEAADRLNCPVGTVKSRCARGRARLLPLLQAYSTGSRNPPAPRGVLSPEDSALSREQQGGRS